METGRKDGESGLAALAKEYFGLKTLKDSFEERVKILNKSIEEAAKRFHETCLCQSTDRITVSGDAFPDGRARTFAPTFRDHASIKPEAREGALNYVFTECPSILKEVFEFGRLSAESKLALQEFNAKLVAVHGREILQFEIHPSTLSAWAASRKEQNLPVPEEFFSVFTRETVSIRTVGSPDVK
jgi:hypothetical protein